MNLSQRMKDLIQKVLADADRDDDVSVEIQMDEFENVYTVFNDASNREQRYVPIADHELFFDRYDNMRISHATDVDCFWDIMNTHYQE